MRRLLHVFLYDRFVGLYAQTEQGLTEFTYDPKYLTAADALPLSQSLPLRAKTLTNQECRGFFAGILPEGENRKVIAKNLGVSAGNDFSLLDQLGGECAGAVTFMKPGSKPTPLETQYRKLSEKELVGIINDLPKRPLLAGREGIRLSLAGAQDKLAVYLNGEDIYLPVGNAPSTHILKPAIERYAGIVENEAYCMKLAKALGLNVAEVEIRVAGDKKFLLVERYDRVKTEDTSLPLRRIHQEDFCQALGIAPEQKYQLEGGVSIKQCFDLLREVSTSPLLDLRAMLDAVIFNYLISNHDAHGKNFSLLYPKRDEGFDVQLSPLYDLICTSAYPDLDKNMAMSIGGKFNTEKIDLSHFERMADEAGLGRALVKARVKEVAKEVLDKNCDAHATVPEIMDLVNKNAKKVLDQH